jgi:hypothetical protein
MEPPALAAEPQLELTREPRREARLVQERALAEPRPVLTRLPAGLRREETFHSKAEDTRTFGLTGRSARWIATACTLSMACAAGARW